ncbi:MFS transporter [Streptomyces sp. RS10V-4]|uniref:MDR family MFS transporter n=1 Tax=Streptomyces rhizoryzae TaxID=2932493 RepID=UPI002004F6D3|nr:MFS transporter [Streptomyces rhizoryzae]MCK7622632.1 MFS transporter [Streptomyces rhizoryzae]
MSGADRSAAVTPGGLRESRLRAFVRVRAGGLPGAFWVLWGGSLVNRLGAMVNPFLSLYLTGVRHVPLATAGLVLAVGGIGSVISQPLGGFLADRFGRRIALTGGMLANGATLLTLGHARSLPVLVASCFVLGITLDLFRPAAQALVADAVPAADRTRAFGLLLWAVNLGFSLAMVLGGYLAAHGFGLLFWLDAGACAVFGALVWLAVPETRPAGRAPTAGGFGTVLRDRVMVAFAGIIVLYAVVFQQAFATLPLAMRATGISSGAYGAVMAVNGLVVIAAQPLIGHRLDGHDKSRVLATGFAVAAAGNALTATAASAPVYGLAVAVSTLGEILVFAVTAAVVADLAPPALRGRYNGLIGMAWGTGFLIAPVAGTRLLALGPAALWLSCAALALLAALAQLALAPALRRRSSR